MRSLINLSLVFLVFSWAHVSIAGECPEISGTYLCHSEANTYNLKISQQTERAATVYRIIADRDTTIKNFMLTADGLNRSFDSKDEDFVTSNNIKATCFGDKLESILQKKIYQNNTENPFLWAEGHTKTIYSKTGHILKISYDSSSRVWNSGDNRYKHRKRNLVEICEQQ